MIKFYKTLENRMTELPEYSEGCWVSAVCPTPDEIRYLIEQLGVDAQYISAALDEEESSRIESEDGQTLVIIDVPYMEEEQEEKTVVYTTTSIGIILTPANFITVSARETLVIDEFAEGRVKGVQTHLKTRFLLAILLRVAARFQLYLKQIDRRRWRPRPSCTVRCRTRSCSSCWAWKRALYTSPPRSNPMS